MNVPAKMPEWALGNVRKAVLRNLQWFKATHGYDLPTLKARVRVMDENELAEMCGLTEAIVSLLNLQYRHAEGIFDDKEVKRLARRTKKALDAMFKRGEG